MSKKKTAPAEQPEELLEDTLPAEDADLAEDTDAIDYPDPAADRPTEEISDYDDFPDEPPARPIKRDKNSVISDLVELGRQKGKLTDQEIMDAMEHFDFDPEQMDKLYEQLAPRSRGRYAP